MTDANFPTFETEPENNDEENADDGAMAAFTGGFDTDNLPEEASYITVRTTGGDSRYVPTSEAMSVQDVLQASGLYISGRVEYFFNQAPVTAADMLPVGGTLTVIGAVKGG